MLLLLAACASDTELASSEAGNIYADPVDPAPYVVDDTAPADSPGLSAEQVGDAIGLAIDAAFAIDPADLADAYEESWENRDAACPYYYPDYLELYGLYIWSDSCTSETGYEFDGYAYYQSYHDYVGSYYTYDRYFYLYSSAMTLTRPDGQSLTGSGYSTYYDIDYWAYGYSASYASIQGTFDWAGGAWAGSWLSQGLSVDFTVNTTAYASGPRYVTVDGSLGDISGEITAANFDSLYVQSPDTGTSCPTEPGGQVRIRDAEGTWYEVNFDGPAYAGAPSFPAYCDGCGEVWWRGENIGSACPDFSRALAWTDRPWG